MWTTIWYSSVSLLSVVLLWVCLSHPAIRPFVHFLVHFLLLLAFETLCVNDDTIMKSVKLLQILSSNVLLWVCLFHQAIRPFVHFSTFSLIAGYWVYFLCTAVMMYIKNNVVILYMTSHYDFIFPHKNVKFVIKLPFLTQY